MNKKSSLLEHLGLIAIFIFLPLVLGIFLRNPSPEVTVLPQESTPSAMVKNAGFRQGTYRVTRVLDGDTIELQGRIRVRYEGVDAPEKYEAYGQSSAKYNQELVAGKEVLIVPTEEKTDIYGRVLAYVYVQDTFINQKMIEAGYARLFNFKGYKKPEKYDQLKAAEDFARSRHLGIWLEE